MDLRAIALHEACIIRAEEAVRLRLLIGGHKQAPRKALRRLHGPEFRAVRRRRDDAVLDHLDRVLLRHGGNRRAVLPGRLDDGLNRRARDERPRRVVDEHDIALF